VTRPTENKYDTIIVGAAIAYLIKGLQLVMAIKRARVPWYKQAIDLARGPR
jgi:hypothetical protein